MPQLRPEPQRLDPSVSIIEPCSSWSDSQTEALASCMKRRQHDGDGRDLLLPHNRSLWVPSTYQTADDPPQKTPCGSDLRVTAILEICAPADTGPFQIGTGKRVGINETENDIGGEQTCCEMRFQGSSCKVGPELTQKQPCSYQVIGPNKRWALRRF